MIPRLTGNTGSTVLLDESRSLFASPLTAANAALRLFVMSITIVNVDEPLEVTAVGIVDGSGEVDRNRA